MPWRALLPDELAPLWPLLRPPFAPLPPGDPQTSALLAPPLLQAMMKLDLPGAFHHQCADVAALPPGVQETLKRRLRRQAMHQMRLEAAEQQTLSLLANVGLRAVPIKGLDLGRAFGAWPGERPTRDADLLCPLPQLARAVAVLEQAGYAQVRRYRPQPPPGYFHDVALVSPAHRVVVELHHHFFDRQALRHSGEDPQGAFMDWFWRHGVADDRLTPPGRWAVCALRWAEGGFTRGLCLRDLVMATTALGEAPSPLLKEAPALGLGLLFDTAWETAGAVAGLSPALSPLTQKVLRLTLPTLARPRPEPGKKVWWLTRPAAGKKIALRRLLLPGAQQLAMSLKQPVQPGPGYVVAWLRWLWRGV